MPVSGTGWEKAKATGLDVWAGVIPEKAVDAKGRCCFLAGCEMILTALPAPRYSAVLIAMTVLPDWETHT